MDRIDYFAAHAPVDIPDWFEFNPATPRPEQIDFKLKLNEEDRVAYDDWHFDACDLPPHLEWIIDARDKNYAEIAQYDKSVKESRYFHWRLYYANKMTKLLNIANYIHNLPKDFGVTKGG